MAEISPSDHSDWILKAMLAVAAADGRLDSREIGLIQQIYKDQSGQTLTAEETQAYVKQVRWHLERYEKQKSLITLPGMEESFSEGGSALRRGQWDVALAKYKRVVKAYPESPEANYNLALVYDQTGRSSEAIAQYLRALTLNPYFKEAYYNLAILYEKLGKYRRAVRIWEAYLHYEVQPEEVRQVQVYIKELEDISKQ